MYIVNRIEDLCARDASKAHPNTKLAPLCSTNHPTRRKCVEVAKMLTTTPQFTQLSTQLFQSLKSIV